VQPQSCSAAWHKWIINPAAVLLGGRRPTWRSGTRSAQGAACAAIVSAWHLNALRFIAYFPRRNAHVTLEGVTGGNAQRAPTASRINALFMRVNIGCSSTSASYAPVVSLRCVCAIWLRLG